jgi:alkyl hydroperoxide reductase subunit AhpC
VSALVWDQVLGSRTLSDNATALARAESGRAAAAGAAADAIVVIDLDGIVRLHIVP